MKPTIIIPARWASSRFPGKPLVPIAGAHVTEEDAEPKTLIRRTWEAAVASCVGPVYVATDDSRVMEHVAGFGGNALMTPRELRNGTERCAFAARALKLDHSEVVINLQGDALLTPPEWLVALWDFMNQYRLAEVATIISRPPGGREPHPGDVSASYSDKTGRIGMFSRSRVPSAGPWWLHYGIYAYQVSALRRYCEFPKGEWEEAEGLEQLHWLEYGIAGVRGVIAPPGRLPRCEINYPGDVPWAEEELRSWGIE